MSINLIFRKFESKDSDSVIELLQEISNFRPTLEMDRSIFNTFLNQNDTYSCVAVKDQKVIAYGSVHVYMRVRGGKSGVIEDMVVAEKMRGQGVGRQLLSALVLESRERGCFKITLEASKLAESFYQSSGFKLSGRVMKLIL